MSKHLTKIGSTYPEITQGKALVNGAVKDIYEGRTLINGAGKHIYLGVPLYKLPVGDVIKIDIAGKPREFIIVNQGNPDPTIYDSSCNDTWVMMKDVYSAHHWDNDSSHYADSDVHKYLNEEFIYLFDSKMRSVIKEVKIPYARQCTREDDGNWQENDATSVYLGSQGLSAKVFLLSGPEVNWSPATCGGGIFGWFNCEGSCLDYFKDFAEVDLRRGSIPHPTSSKHYASWWLRSKIRSFYDYQVEVWFVLGRGDHESKGSINGSGVAEESGVWLRPAMVLPNRLRVNMKSKTLRI